MRVALVTGAARGIGAAITDRLLTDGWRVVAADRHAEALSRLAPRPARRVQTANIADIEGGMTRKMIYEG
jgi:NAD(P)-dependent dehydrogenase (short-subunit alcohol dehydrogenase family)